MFANGDMYKSGFLGNGLSVSPAKDTVVAPQEERAKEPECGLVALRNVSA